MVATGRMLTQTSQWDVDTELQVWGVALDTFTRMDVHRGRAECMLSIADVYVECTNRKGTMGDGKTFL